VLSRFRIEARRALRRLMRAPAFSLSVVALLAIGIGGTAAVGTAAYDLLARPLPYAEPGRLVDLGVQSRRLGFRMGLSAVLADEVHRDGQFAALGIMAETGELVLDSGDVRTARIDHRIVDVVGMSPLVGRGFDGDDVRPGAEPVVLIGERFWRDRFGADGGAVGSSLELADGGRVRIVGVLPDDFALPDGSVSVWRPMKLGPDELDPANASSFGNLEVIARLPQGVSTEQAQQRFAARLAADERLEWLTNMLEAEFRVFPLRERWSEGRTQGLAILGGALALLLLASLFNIAGLWMARWFGRTRELAVQVAIGGGRGLSFVGALLEYAWLSLPAIALGLVVAWGATELLFDLGIIADAGPLTTRVGGITVAIGLGLAVIGALPVIAALAWQLRGIDRAGMRFLGGGGTATRTAGLGLRRALTIGQIAIAFSLITVFWLLFSSWNKLLEQDLGFEPQRLVLASVLSTAGARGDPSVGWTGDPRVAAVAERLRALPGVTSASWSNAAPFGGNEMVASAWLDAAGEQSLPVRQRTIGPAFFETMGVDLVQGRGFESADAGTDRVIVDRLLADRHFAGDALGKTLWRGGEDESRQVRIIGVAETVRHMSLDQPVESATLYHYGSETPGQAHLLLRTEVAPATLVDEVRETMESELGPERVGTVAVVESLVRRIVRDREPQLVLMAIFAGLTLVLVFYGLYALQSYQVAARTSELGLRMAMGASGGRVLRDVLSGALFLATPGLALGTFAGWAVAALFADRLYQTDAVAPLVWLAVAGALCLVVALAALAPGLRAVRISPMEALRDE
jgi:putative ABC transport system permease protein